MTTPSAKQARPLSPHLSVYKPQMSSVLSIFHRATGVALAAGVPVLVAWIVAVAAGPDIYALFTGLFHNIVGQILLFGWSFSFFYHFWAGIRHLVWDAGWFLHKKGMAQTGWFVVGITAISTLATWAKIWGLWS